ncbi:hypothetical protein SLE2022_193790 [Rubroshorea leprosula]
MNSSPHLAGFMHFISPTTLLPLTVRPQVRAPLPTMSNAKTGSESQNSKQRDKTEKIEKVLALGTLTA